MKPQRRESIINSLLAEKDPILATEECSGATPLHLGLEFLQASDEAISGPLEEFSMAIIFTPTKEAYDGHENFDQGDLGMTDEVEEVDEHAYDERMGSFSRLGRKNQTQLCIDDWLLKHGARGKTAKLLSRIQIISVKDLAQLAVCLSTFPSPHFSLPKSSISERSGSRILIMVHDMSILPLLSPLSSPTLATAVAPPSSPARSASGPLQDEVQDQRLSIYVSIAGHALAAVDLVSERLLVLDSGLDEPSLKILRCYLDEDPEMDYVHTVD